MDIDRQDLGLWNVYKNNLLQDETNFLFGKKEEGNKLYEVQNIAHIETGEPTFRNPSVSLIQGENQVIVVAADSFVTILGDDGTQYKSTVNTECKVDAMCLRTDGEMVIVADSRGAFHIISVASGNIIFSHQVVNRSCNTNCSNDGNHVNECCGSASLFCSVKCFTDQEKDSYCIALGLKSGKFFVCTNLRLKLLEKAFNTNDMEMAAQVKTYVKMKEYDASLIHTKEMTDIIAVDDGISFSFFTLGKGQKILASWKQPFSFAANPPAAYLQLQCSVDSSLVCNDDEIKIIKCIPFFENLYTLDSYGCLCQWDCEHLMLRRCWTDARIKDFTVTDSGHINHCDSGKLYAAVVDSVTNDLSLSVFQLPTFNMIFSVKCGGQAFCKIAVGSLFTETIIFVDGLINCISGKVSQIRINSVSEASPEDRLFRLLNKHRYDEAEKFAQAMCLNLQDVYEQKASYLVNTISSGNDNECFQVTFKNLKDTLAKITNSMIAAELCIEAVLPDLQMSYELLMFSRMRIGGCLTRRMQSSSSFNENDSHEYDMIQQIDHLLNRLVTYQLAFGRKASRTTSQCSTEWVDFRDAYLPVELTRLLSAGNISAAAIILLRHKADLFNFLESTESQSVDRVSVIEKRLQTFLDYIPDTVDVDILVPWFEKSLVPTLLARIPCSLKILAAWLHTKAESYEQSKAGGWPENGIKIASVLFTVQNQLSSLGYMSDQVSAVSQAFKSTMTEISNLRVLVSRLQLLLRLKQNYKCNVTLSEFIQETTMSLTYRMLDRVVVPELVLSVLETTVRPYMREHSLDEEEVLFGYVEDLISHCPDQAWGSVESLAERRVVAIIKCMKHHQKILEASVKLAKIAVVPWSEDTQALVERAVEIAKSYKISEDSQENVDEEMVTRRSVLLKELQYYAHVEQLPSVLAEYGVSNVGLKNTTCHVQFIRFLINKNTEESLAHAHHFARTFTTVSALDVYKYRLLYLLKQNQVLEYVNLLESALEENSELGFTLVRRAINFAKCMLANTDDIWKEERKIYCRAAIDMIEYMIKECEMKKPNQFKNVALEKEFFEELHNDLKLLSNVLILQEKYNKCITVQQYGDNQFTERLLTSIVLEFDSSCMWPSVDKSDSAEKSWQQNSSASLRSENNATNSIFIDATSVEDGNACANKSMTFAHILNIAKILRVPHEILRGQIAMRAAKRGEKGSSTAILICNELIQYSPTEETAGVVFKILLEMMQHWSKNFSYGVKIIPELYKLMCTVMAYAHQDIMEEAVNVCRFFKLGCRVCEVTDVNSNSFMCQQSFQKENTFKSLAFLHPEMEDTGCLRLKADQVLPLLLQTSEILVNKDNAFNAEHVDVALRKLHKVASEAGNILQMARQSHLALRWILLCVSASLQRVADVENKSTTASNLIPKMVVDEGKKIVSEYANECIKKVLANREIDVDLVVGLLTLIPIEQAHVLLQSELNKSGSNYKRIMSITSASIATLKLNTMHSQVKKFQGLFIDSHWGNALRKMKISFESVLFSAPSSKSAILPGIIRHPETTATLIKDFCNDYSLDSNAALLDFAHELLADPNYTVICTEAKSPLLGTGGFGAGDNMQISPLNLNRSNMLMLAVESQPAFSLKRNAKTGEKGEGDFSWKRTRHEVKQEMNFIMSEVNDRQELCHHLIKILRQETSPYHYKQSKFLLHLIEECQTVQSEVDVDKGLQLIECLKFVRRTKPVSEYERQKWNVNAETKTMMKLPALSKDRLPLHPFLFGDCGSAWKILGPELDDRSAARLVPIGRLLSLKINKFYMTAAENVIRSHMEKNKEHQLTMTIQQLASMRSLIAGIDDYKMATAMAKRIAELLLISSEKVEAYEWCTSLSEKWLDTLTPDHHDYSAVANTHSSLCQFYRNSATELVLHNYSLLSSTTASLIYSPEKLIYLLYCHESIVQRYHKPDAEKYPDIHEAANKIAKIHSCNVMKLRLTISIEWLYGASGGEQDDNEEDDTTVNLANVKAANDLESQTAASIDEDVIKLLYILSYAPNKLTAKFLLNFTYDQRNARITNVTRVRGLQSVLHLFDDAFIEQITNKKISVLRDQLRILVYLTELEKFGFSISGAKLQSQDKAEVARSILTSPDLRRRPGAVRVAAELCREYGVWCPNIWQLILQQIVTLRQIGYLRQLLTDICCHPDLASLPCLATVWQSCVTLPLSTMTPPLSKEEVNGGIKSYEFLLGCPVLLQVDIPAVAQHFLCIDLSLLALGCLLADPSQYDNANQLALNQHDKIKLQLYELSRESHLIMGQFQIAEFMSKFNSANNSKK